MKDNEFEKRFLYIKRDLIQENKFSIARSELGKIIHNAKSKSLSEILDQARILLRFCNIKERELENGIEEGIDFETYAIAQKRNEEKALYPQTELMIREELTKARSLIFQKKILEGKRLLINVIEELNSLPESVSSSIFGQASEILDYCKDFKHNKKKLSQIEYLIKKKKFVKVFICLKELIVEIRSYIGEKYILNKEILNKALDLFQEDNLAEQKEYSIAAIHLKNLIDEIEQKEYPITATHLKDLIYSRDKVILNKEILNIALVILDKKSDLQISYFEKIVNMLNISNFIQDLRNLNEFAEFTQNRSKLFEEIYSFYIKHKNDDLISKKIVNLFIQFYSSYFEINPFEIDIQNFSMSFKNFKENEFRRLKAIIKENEKLEIFYKKLKKIDFNFFMDESLRLLSEKVNVINFDVPIENMFNFLLDFSQIILGSTKTEDSTEDKYTINTGWGPLHFKIIEKEQNKKITYKYDFLPSMGEKGICYIELTEQSPGKVTIKTRNHIHEISEEAREKWQIYNFLGKHLKVYLDLVIGKIVARVIQTTFYEKDFDDLTIGNYRILQAKLNALGKDINKLKAKYFEVKAPLTLNSFNCSECGATLKISSKKEKLIVCEYCTTPFLMEWQSK
ncbi:MAG: hypothetical protein ACFE88_13925 [Candidatus Hermodarchaeota archaeon]